MLNILLITDHKPGHESISTGILKYISDKNEVDRVEVYAQIRAKFLKVFATLIINNINLNQKIVMLLIKIFYKNFNFNFNKKVDLIISTGGDTSFLNVLLAKYLSVPNIYCSSLRGLDNNLFTHTVSIKDNRLPNEIVVDLSPIYVKTADKELHGSYIAILIGGKTKNYKFIDEEFISLVENSIALAKKFNYKLLITTSRRTPISVEKEIKKIYHENEDYIEKCVLFNEKPQKVVNYFLSNADVIFCTEDSGSMITEAILSKKRVYTIRPFNTNLNEIFEIFMTNITTKKYVHSTLVDGISKISFDEEFNALQNSPVEIVYQKISKLVHLK